MPVPGGREIFFGFGFLLAWAWMRRVARRSRRKGTGRLLMLLIYFWDSRGWGGRTLSEWLAEEAVGVDGQGIAHASLSCCRRLVRLVVALGVARRGQGCSSSAVTFCSRAGCESRSEIDAFFAPGHLKHSDDKDSPVTKEWMVCILDFRGISFQKPTIFALQAAFLNALLFASSPFSHRKQRQASS